MLVKNIIRDDDCLEKFSRVTYELKVEVDSQYLAGKFKELISHGVKDKVYADLVNRKYINESMLFNETIELGSRGLYYLVLRKGYKIDQLLFQPDELSIDLYVHKDSRLIYSFYNPTLKRNINIKGKISEDIDGIARKIKANLDDIYFRNYFLKLATEDYGKEIKIPEYFPPIMNAQQAANYLGIKEKTIRKWTSEAKIPFTKIGNTVRYRKSDLDGFLDKQTKHPKIR